MKRSVKVHPGEVDFTALGEVLTQSGSRFRHKAECEAENAADPIEGRDAGIAATVLEIGDPTLRHPESFCELLLRHA